MLSRLSLIYVGWDREKLKKFLLAIIESFRVKFRLMETARKPNHNPISIYKACERFQDENIPLKSRHILFACAIQNNLSILVTMETNPNFMFFNTICDSSSFSAVNINVIQPIWYPCE